MKKILLIAAAGFVAYGNTQAQTKNCLIEEFTSSTCPPCAGMNAWLDPLLNSKNANEPNSQLVVIKYQMNFPTKPSLDASYSSQQSQLRASYYISGLSSWGIPLHFTNGKWHDTAVGGGTNQTMVESELNSCKTGTAKMNITGSYTVKSISATEDSIFISITVTPTQTLTGSYNLMVGATERFYQNTNTATGHYTTQTDFYHVMRKMYPNASNGTTITNLTANVPQTFTFADKITIGNVTLNSNNWWSNPYDGSVVAFVEDRSLTPLRGTNRVMQAQAIHAQWATNVENVGNFKNIKVFPNPASNQVVVFFNLGQATAVSAEIYDMAGRLVTSVPAQQFGTSAEKMLISLDNVASGNYVLKLTSAQGSITQPLTVSK